MGNMLAFLGRDMAVDLGTANTLVYVRRRGIALNEPSVVALNTNTGKVVAVGSAAELLARSGERTLEDAFVRLLGSGEGLAA